jgi:hypothetical protein
MTKKYVHPELDKEDAAHAWTDLALFDADTEALKFTQAHPEFYASEDNCDKVENFIRERQGIFNLRNFEIAYHALRDELELRPVAEPDVPEAMNERAIPHIHSTQILPFTISDTPENREALLQHESELRGLSDIGKPVSGPLKQAHQESLRRWRQWGNYTPQQIAEARAVIGTNFPDVKRDSYRFNQLVGEHLLSLN